MKTVMTRRKEHWVQTTPHLNGSQRAYLFRRDQFLAGIKQRAEALFTEGYSVHADREPHVFVVICPDKKGSLPFYRVDLWRQSCTCPFYTRQGSEPLTGDGTRVPCKHLVGLPGLIHATCRDHVHKRNLGRYYRLWVQWRRASALRPDLTAHWLALGPVCARVSTDFPSSTKEGICTEGTRLTTEIPPTRETQPRKEQKPCTGTTSPSG